MASTLPSFRTPEPSERNGADNLTNMSPGQAKEELLSLNDRLAVYIKKIRSLTEENNNLTIEISVMKKSQQTEVEQVRRWYEKELAEATKEKAQEQYENRKNGELADEYKKK